MTERVVVEVEREAGCEDVPLPAYQTEDSAGMDLRAAVAEPLTIPRGGIALVPTGLRIALPRGFEAQVRPRSGLALKHGVVLPNAPGTIDSDYRGEVCVILANVGRQEFVVRRGMRIAQMVDAPVVRAEVDCEDHLPETRRGAGGFGHTGV